MPAPQNLTDVYVDELRDLWSANDQMQALVKDLVSKAEDGRLKEIDRPQALSRANSAGLTSHRARRAANPHNGPLFG